MKKITIYTDGSCHGNPGPGGWAAVLIYRNINKELSGGCKYTTNNRMELTAAIEALKALKEPCEVTIHTDSAYLHRANSEHWIDRWLANGWKTANKKDVLNVDLWKELRTETARHSVFWQKVAGHSDCEMNNRCDELANIACDLAATSE